MKESVYGGKPAKRGRGLDMSVPVGQGLQRKIIAIDLVPLPQDNFQSPLSRPEAGKIGEQVRLARANADRATVARVLAWIEDAQK